MSKFFKRTPTKVIASEEYQIEKAKIDFAAELQTTMIEKSLSKAKLADQLQERKKYIGDILHGDSDFTIVDLARIAKALDCDLTISLTKKNPSNI